MKELRPELNIIAVRSGKGKKVEEEKLLNAVVHSLEEAIDCGIEAAIIATPAVFHFAQAIFLIAHGIHVLIEKPISHSLNNMDDLLKMQKESNSVALVGYCLRYNSGALKFKEMLRNKKIGELLHVKVECGSYLPDWRLGQDYRKSVSAKEELGGGVLLEISHELDYIRWFFGEMKSVYANIKNSNTLEIDVEDSADMILEPMQGYPISIHLDFNSRISRRECIARCSNGDLIWNVSANKVTWQTAKGFEELGSYNNDRDYVYKEQLKHFFDCIENKKSPSVSINDGIAVLQMIEAAKKSHRIGEKVALS
jgi:predicted dehydrogenase